MRSPTPSRNTLLLHTGKQCINIVPPKLNLQSSGYKTPERATNILSRLENSLNAKMDTKYRVMERSLYSEYYCFGQVHGVERSSNGRGSLD